MNEYDELRTLLILASKSEDGNFEDKIIGAYVTETVDVIDDWNSLILRQKIKVMNTDSIKINRPSHVQQNIFVNTLIHKSL